MVPLLPLRDGVRALPISFFRQSMPSFYMNAPDCICSPGRLPLGAFCTGRDGRYGQDWPTRCAFQSAHPVRGATGGSAEAANGMVDFNPRTPCGVRRHRAQARRWWGNFNPRTPCGVRLLSNIGDGAIKLFQSTHPVRGATVSADEPRRPKLYFNPRTPCGVRPSALYATAIGGWHFNPRTPCGVRPRRALAQRPPSVFQSTHPVRGATMRLAGTYNQAFISIHAPRAGCDF